MTDTVAVRVGSRSRLSSPLLIVLVGLGFAAVGIATPFVIGSALVMTLLVQATTNAIFATGVGTLVRMNGSVSFGHAAFFGLSAYIVGLGFNQTSLPPELVILLALIAPTILAFVVGLGIVVIQGIAFGMLTMAVGQGLYEVAMKARSLTGSDDGLIVVFPNRIFGLPSGAYHEPHSMFIICWLLLIVILCGLTLLSHSKFGRLAIAIRENEERARFIGYKTRVHRALVLALSAFLAAIAGALSVIYNAYVSPEALHWSVSGMVVLMVIIGGQRVIWGPAFGATLFFLFKEVVGDFTDHWQSFVGLTLIAVTLLLPEGLGGYLAQKFASGAKR